MKPPVDLSDRPFLLTKAEIAKKLRVSERTIDTWRKEGIIPALKIRARVLFEPKEVLAALKSRRER